MTEASIKLELTAFLKQELNKYVVIRHEDKATYGIPDMSITGCGRTSWWEIKFANPSFVSRGSQELMMRRLANVGTARYIIFELMKGDHVTRIIEPKHFTTWKTAGRTVGGFDHPWIAAIIREIHENDYVRS